MKENRAVESVKRSALLQKGEMGICADKIVFDSK